MENTSTSNGHLNGSASASCRSKASDRDSIVSQHKSYRDYLTSLAEVRPEYEWLRHFMNTSGSPSSETLVDILDIDTVDKKVKEQGQFSATTPEFGQALLSPPPTTHTRLIITSYHLSWAIDRDIINTLAFEFDIDPDFLRQHFYYEFIQNEPLLNDSIRQEAVNEVKEVTEDWLPIPSERRKWRGVHFSYTREYEKLSAYLVPQTRSATQTVLIWIRSDRGAHFPPPLAYQYLDTHPRPSIFSEQITPRTSHTESLARRYIAAIRQLSEQDITIGKADPYYFLLPYLKYLIWGFYYDHKEEYDIESRENFKDAKNGPLDPTDLDSKLFQLQFEIGRLNGFLQEVDSLSITTTSLKLREECSVLLADLTDLKMKFEKSVSHFASTRNEILVNAQIQETKASTRAAITVTRLSKLAFIFIPISFVTSFFGMNVAEFGQGSIPIRTFFITAAAIGLCALLPISPSILRSLRTSGWAEDPLIFVKLVKHSPTSAFWYIGLCAHFEHPAVMGLCGSALAGALGLSERTSQSSMSRRQAKFKMRESRHSEQTIQFWLHKAGLLEDLAYRILDESL